MRNLACAPKYVIGARGRQDDHVDVRRDRACPGPALNVLPDTVLQLVLEYKASSPAISSARSAAFAACSLRDSPAPRIRRCLLQGSQSSAYLVEPIVQY